MFICQLGGERFSFWAAAYVPPRSLPRWRPANLRGDRFRWNVLLSLQRFITPLFDFPALTLRVPHVKNIAGIFFCRGLFTQIMNQSIIYLRLCTGPVISAGHYHIQTRETCIIRRRLECVRKLTACERRPDEPESSDMDFCLQEMGPCLLPLTQACTECNNTISLYYITLIWILPIASTHTRARPPSPRTAQPGQRLCGGFHLDSSGTQKLLDAATLCITYH